MADKRRTIKRVIISALVCLGLLGLLYLVLHLLGLTGLGREDIQAFVEGTGALAPIVFIIVSFLQVTFIPIPSTVTVLAGAYLFGALPSFFLSYIGINLGAVVAFELGRGIGRPFAVWVAGSEEELDGWVAHLGGRERALLWLMFLFPLFPDDTLCTVAGLLKISRLEFLLMQLITRTTSIGATLLLMSGEIIPYEGWGLAVIISAGVLFLVASVLALIYYERITDFIKKIADRIKKK